MLKAVAVIFHSFHFAISTLMFYLQENSANRMAQSLSPTEYIEKEYEKCVELIRNGDIDSLIQTVENLNYQDRWSLLRFSKWWRPTNLLILSANAEDSKSGDNSIRRLLSLLEHKDKVRLGC